MKKIVLEELLKIPYSQRNNTILEMYRDEEDLRLCVEDDRILIEEDLETVFHHSNIDLLIGNDELYILVQYNKFYTVKGYPTKSSKDNELIDFGTLKLITYKK